MPRQLTILKFGGSVLRSEADLLLGVNEVQRWLRGGHRVIAVVSAFEGTTDRLLAQSRHFAGEGTAAEETARAMLLATGEFTTASLLGLALASRGVQSRVLGPQAINLRTRGSGADADPASIDRPALLRSLDEAPVAVVPGFIGLDATGNFALLGRGGSDLTALFLASELGATRCRLIKDVDGVYDADPNAPGSTARRFEHLHWNDGLKLDGGIVQHKALRLAQDMGLRFEVGSWSREDVTAVGPEESRLFPAGAALLACAEAA